MGIKYWLIIGLFCIGVESRIQGTGCVPRSNDHIGRCTWLGTSPACGYDCYYGKDSKRLCAYSDNNECRAQQGQSSWRCEGMGVGCATGCYVLYCPDWQ